MDEPAAEGGRYTGSCRKALAVVTLIIVTACSNLESFQWLKGSVIMKRDTPGIKLEQQSLEPELDHGYDMRPYSWIGDHWVPPEGVPTYSASKMISVFSRHNVLFLGDSTMRRTYLMLYEIMNYTAMEHANKTVYATPKENLESEDVIDTSKPGKPFAGCPSEHRDSNPDTNTRGKFLKKSREPFFCRTVPDDRGTTSTGKIDYTRANCVSDAYTFAHTELKNRSNATLMSKEYDIIVFGLGVWEGLRPVECRPSRTTTIKTLRALSKLSKFNGEQAIIWRTSGFDESHRGDQDIREHNDATREYLDDENEHLTHGVSYVDFAANIEPRSYDKDRIKGDIRPHYGIEARYLHINMITHRILELERQRHG